MANPSFFATDTPAPRYGVAVAALPRVRSSAEIVTDGEQFAGMESEWNDAVDRAGVAHPFLRHEWLRTWWDCFGSTGRLHIVVVRSAGEIVAIAPLMRETAWMYGLPVRRLRFLQNDHTPRTDFIVADRPEESYRAIWQALVDSSDRWDLLQLSQIPRGSPTLGVVPALAEEEGYATSVWRGGDSPYLALGQSWDGYLNGVSGKFKQNLRNRLSRLTNLGEPALEVLEDHEAINDARDEALRLEASGWKDSEGTAICCDPAIRRFYTLLAERATHSGWLRLLFLTVNGQRIATAYSSCFQNRLSFLKTGYNPDFAKCSPFKILTYFALRDAFTACLDELDFLGDAEPWKLEWTTTTRPHDWLFIFADTCRGRLLHRVKSQLVPALKRRYA